MLSLLLSAALAAPIPAGAVFDVERVEVGPATWWKANTKKGEAFLAGLPENYIAPIIEVKGGTEKAIGKDKYDPKTKVLWTTPTYRIQILDLAKERGITIDYEE